MYAGQHSFFNSALDRGERLTSLPLALRPGNNLGTRRIGWCVGPKVTVDILRQKKKISHSGIQTRTVHCIKCERKSLEIGEM